MYNFVRWILFIHFLFFLSGLVLNQDVCRTVWLIVYCTISEVYLVRHLQMLLFLIKGSDYLTLLKNVDWCGSWKKHTVPSQSQDLKWWSEVIVLIRKLSLFSSGNWCSWYSKKWANVNLARVFLSLQNPGKSEILVVLQSDEFSGLVLNQDNGI